MRKVLGVPASPGVAIGRAFIYQPTRLGVPEGRSEGQSVPGELAGLDEALGGARVALQRLQDQAEKEIGANEAAIYGAHLTMLDDQVLWDEVRAHVGEGLSAAAATDAVIGRYAGIFAAMEDPLFRDRGADLRDVGDRVIRLLVGVDQPGFETLDRPAIVVAHELTPSTTASFDRSRVLALVTGTGGRTSHTAILARALAIPAVVGVERLLEQVRDGQSLAVDGEAGEVVVEPDAPTLQTFAARRGVLAQVRSRWLAEKGLPAQTLDGRRVELAANVGTPVEVDLAQEYGADGVGLFRTEFLYLNRTDAPDEDEQYAAYLAVIRKMAGRRVIIRTLDVGGDKQVEYLAVGAEANPFLGLRGLRFCLGRPDLFKTQLRAILRASAHGPVGVMFPMVSGVEEVTRAKEALEEARRELEAEGCQPGREFEVGVMIEVPSAALVAEALAKHVDFLSIGTNDLVQYTLAVDRLNERVASLYQPFHPAVLRLIQMVIAGGRRAGKRVGMCGEMAGDPLAVPVLVGLGLDEFSMAPASVPRVRAIVRSLNLERASAFAHELLRCESAAEVVQAIRHEGEEDRG